jgi:hypothetical protein
VNDAWIVWTSLGLGAGFLVAGFVVAASRRRLVPAAVATVTVAVVAWLVGVAAIGNGWADADGFVDCRDSCTGVQYAAAAVFLGGPLFFVLGVAALVAACIRVGRTRPPGARRR